MSLHCDKISNRSRRKWVRRIACDVITYNKITAVFKTFVQTTLLEQADKEEMSNSANNKSIHLKNNHSQDCLYPYLLPSTNSLSIRQG